MIKELPEVSSKSTKNEILEAYNTLLGRLKDSEQESPQEIKKHQEEREIVKLVSGLSMDAITKKLIDLKLIVNNELTTLEQKILDEHKKFNNLQEAIKIESKNLEELYEIKKNADALAALILAHKEYKNKFEMEVKELKKEREREEEEYNYNINLDRKRDNDEYEAYKQQLEKELMEKKASFEKEIFEREALLVEKEEEFKNLQEKVQQFNSELEKSIKEAEKSTREAIESKYKHQLELSVKEIEGERKLNQQIIYSLQEKIKEQESYINQLTQRANESTKQVQSIALKALESSSSPFRSFDDYKKSSQSSNV